MNIAFLSPSYMWLLLVPVALLLFGLRSNQQHRIPLLLRTITLAAIVIALMQPYEKHSEEQQQLAAIVDVSASIPDTAYETYAEEIARFLDAGSLPQLRSAIPQWRALAAGGPVRSLRGPRSQLLRRL